MEYKSERHHVKTAQQNTSILQRLDCFRLLLLLLLSAGARLSITY